MAEEIKKVISIDTKGAESVKDLIDKVEKLRGILKTLDETSDEYKTTLGELKSAQDNLTSSLGNNQVKAEAAEGSYNALAQQMKVLKKEWKATSDEAERNALGKEIKDINDQLKTLDQSIGNNQRNVGNYAGSFQSLKQEIREARDVMAAAARGSDEYAEAAKRAADASAKLRDMQEEIVKGDAGLDNQFAVTSNLLGSISGGFAAAQGAMALFGAESENLQKTFVKLQAAMSMTQGFKALAELPKGLNAAKIAFGGVTTGVKNFIKGLNGVKGAIAATGIGLLLVLLGELIANWDAVTEAVSNFVGGMDGLTEKLAGVGNVIKNLVTGPLKAFGQALRLDFKGAAETLKNSFSIAANYSEGAAKQATKNVQKNLREQAAARAKDLDYQIRMNEAKEGSDWKYTEDAKKMYDEYFQKMLAQYDENSDEYNEMLIKMEAYNREFTDHQKQEEEKRNQAAKEAAERAKQIAEQQRQAYEDAASAAGEAVLTQYGKQRKELENTILSYEPLIEEAFKNPPFKKYGEELIKSSKETLAEYEKEIRESLGRAGLTYDGLMDTIKNGTEETLAFYVDAVGSESNEVSSKISKAMFILMNKNKAVLTNLSRSTWEEIKNTLEQYSTMAQESIKKGVLNEGDWILFEEAIHNIVTDVTNEIELQAYEIAKTYKLTGEELNGFREIWAAGVGSVFGKVKDENWKYTEEGKKLYEAYYADLFNLYNDDFVNWMKVVDEKSKYELEVRKYNDAQIKKALKEQLADNLTQIDQYQEQLQRKADFDFWSRMFGSSKEDVERGFKEYEAMVKELDELGGTGNIIIPADAGMERTKTLKEELGSVFTWIREESLKTYDEEIANNNAYLANFIQGINIQIEELNKELELKTLTADERKSIEAEIAAFEQQKAEETYRVYAKNKDKEVQKAKKIEQAKKSLASSTADVFGGLSDYMSALSDRNAKTNEESARKQFEASKALGITETIISTLATVQNIIKSFSGLGPWGTVAGVAAGAAALASGMARVAQIRNQTFDSPGGDTSSSVNITSAVAVPQLESNPYQYTSNVTNAADEDELNKPIIVQVSDVEDAMKVRESRSVETSF